MVNVKSKGANAGAADATSGLRTSNSLPGCRSATADVSGAWIAELGARFASFIEASVDWVEVLWVDRLLNFLNEMSGCLAESAFTLDLERNAEGTIEGIGRARRDGSDRRLSELNRKLPRPDLRLFCVLLAARRACFVRFLRGFFDRDADFAFAIRSTIA